MCDPDNCGEACVDPFSGLSGICVEFEEPYVNIGPIIGVPAEEATNNNPIDSGINVPGDFRKEANPGTAGTYSAPNDYSTCRCQPGKR